MPAVDSSLLARKIYCDEELPDPLKANSTPAEVKHASTLKRKEPKFWTEPAKKRSKITDESNVVDEIDECASPCFEPDEKCSLSDQCGEDGVRPVYSNRVHKIYVVSESGDHHVEERGYHVGGWSCQSCKQFITWWLPDSDLMKHFVSSKPHKIF